MVGEARLTLAEALIRSGAPRERAVLLMAQAKEDAAGDEKLLARITALADQIAK